MMNIRYCFVLAALSGCSWSGHQGSLPAEDTGSPDLWAFAFAQRPDAACVGLGQYDRSDGSQSWTVQAIDEEARMLLYEEHRDPSLEAEPFSSKEAVFEADGFLSWQENRSPGHIYALTQQRDEAGRLAFREEDLGISGFHEIHTNRYTYDDIDRVIDEVEEISRLSPDTFDTSLRIRRQYDGDRLVEVLRTDSDGSVTEYTVYTYPSPPPSRDYTRRAEILEDDGSRRVEVETVLHDEEGNILSQESADEPLTQSVWVENTWEDGLLVDSWEETTRYTSAGVVDLISVSETFHTYTETGALRASRVEKDLDGDGIIDWRETIENQYHQNGALMRLDGWRVRPVWTDLGEMSGASNERSWQISYDQQGRTVEMFLQDISDGPEQTYMEDTEFSTLEYGVHGLIYQETLWTSTRGEDVEEATSIALVDYDEDGRVISRLSRSTGDGYRDEYSFVQRWRCH